MFKDLKSSHIKYSQQQQGDEVWEKIPRLSYKMAEFCELLSSEKTLWNAVHDKFLIILAFL